MAEIASGGASAATTAHMGVHPDVDVAAGDPAAGPTGDRHAVLGTGAMQSFPPTAGRRRSPQFCIGLPEPTGPRPQRAGAVGIARPLGHAAQTSPACASAVNALGLGNGEACYWPNTGYGGFGAKVTMDRAPRFNNERRFDPRRILLTDIDGSRTAGPQPPT